MGKNKRRSRKKYKYWLALVAGVYVTHIPGGGCFFHVTAFWFNRYDI
jgi:hypothetical protein